MPKFYVRSGRFRRVIDRPDAVVAARAAVANHAFDAEGTQSKAISQLGLLTFVSERGFRSGDFATFHTHYLLTRRTFGPDAE